jgi:NADPH:quinone reductase-like Zn-dependent oxidoreductase
MVRFADVDESTPARDEAVVAVEAFSINRGEKTRSRKTSGRLASGQGRRRPSRSRGGDVSDWDDLATLVRLTPADRLHHEIDETGSWEQTSARIADLRAHRVRGKAILHLR